jgi:hypothetical protein
MGKGSTMWLNVVLGIPVLKSVDEYQGIERRIVSQHIAKYRKQLMWGRKLLLLVYSYLCMMSSASNHSPVDCSLNVHREPITINLFVHVCMCTFFFLILLFPSFTVTFFRISTFSGIYTHFRHFPNFRHFSAKQIFFPGSLLLWNGFLSHFYSPAPLQTHSANAKES